MKKKKLKKKIKKLEKKVKKYRSNLATLITQVDISLTKKIQNLSDAYTNKFNKFNPIVLQNEIDDLNHRMNSISMVVEYLMRSTEETKHEEKEVEKKD